MLDARSFFDLTNFVHADLFAEGDYVWDALKNLKKYMSQALNTELKSTLINDASPLSRTVILHEGEILDGTACQITFGDTTKGKMVVEKDGSTLEGASVIMAGSVLIGKKIQIGKGVLIESGALIKEPTIIGDQTEVRQGAYLRGYCLIGSRCVVGHTTEVKHSIFLNDAKAGHFAYLGDSILGDQVNLGAGTKMANLRFLAGNVKIKTEDGLIETGLRKFGAILGDNAQTGCNSVTNPGTLMGKESILMPNTTAKSGYHPEETILR